MEKCLMRFKKISLVNICNKYNLATTNQVDTKKGLKPKDKKKGLIVRLLLSNYSIVRNDIQKLSLNNSREKNTVFHKDNQIYKFRFDVRCITPRYEKIEQFGVYNERSHLTFININVKTSKMTFIYNLNGTCEKYPLTLRKLKSKLLVKDFRRLRKMYDSIFQSNKILTSQLLSDYTCSDVNSIIMSYLFLFST